MIPNQITRMNNTMKTVLTAVAIALLGCNMLCEQAKAVLPPITGDIHFDGSASASGTSPGTPVTITPNNDWEVLGFPAPTGTVASVTPGTAVTFNPFSFTGNGNTATLTAPVLPEWSFTFNGTTYSFDLTSLTNGSVSLSNGAAMDFTGTGLLHASGATNFADTAATFAMSGTGEDLTFILSEAHNTAVPEGGVTSLLILGIGIFGGKSLLRRRDTSSKA
jgi:hypothetical protein